MNEEEKVDPALLKFASFDITNSERRIHLKEKGSNRLKTLGIIQNINQFAVCMWQALQVHKPELVFEPAYPTYVLDRAEQDIRKEITGTSIKDMPDELITWNVIRRTPGTVSGSALKSSVNSGGVREIRPSIREELVYDPYIYNIDPVQPDAFSGPGGYTPDPTKARVMGQQVEGQFFDNLVQFDIWSRNNKSAEELADYLEDFMTEYRGMFIELGTTKLHFHSRIRDEMILNWKNGLSNRSLIYYVRTEKVNATPVREIKMIHVDASIKNMLEEIDRKDVDQFIEDENKKTIERWIEKNRSN